MKKLRCLLLFCILLLSVYYANAYSFQYNGLYYKITSSSNSSVKTCEVTYGPSGKGQFSDVSDYTISDVVIPEGVAYNGSRYLVTSVGDYAFANCQSIRNLTVESSTVRIGRYAFYNCFNLLTVKLNESVKTIDDYAFTNSSAISSFSMPGVESIGKQSLGWLKKIKTLEIPACTKTVNDEALACLTSLESINVNKDNLYFTSENGILFSKDKTKIIHFPESRTGEYTVPDGTQEIAALCFFWSNLKKITVANSVKKIGARAFGSCLYLETIDLGQGVEDMGSYGMFMYCPSLKQIVVPNSVKTIGQSFVSLCPNLEEIIFGESVEKFMDSYIVTLWGNDSEGIPNNECLKNIVMLSKTVPTKHYNTSNGKSNFPITPCGRRELNWESNSVKTFNYVYSGRPRKNTWYEPYATDFFTGLFCKGDTLFAYSNNTKKSKPTSLSQYAYYSDYKYNKDATFYHHGYCMAFVFGNREVDPKQFVGRKISGTELIGKTVENIDACGMPTFMVYTTPLIENTLPADSYNVNTYRVINFAYPSDDGNGYPYYLIEPTVGERCKVTGVYNTYKGGLYDPTTGFTLKLRNASDLKNGTTYTLEGVYRKPNGAKDSYEDGEAILELLNGDSFENSISKQPTADNLSVSLEHANNAASYQWYALSEANGYKEALAPSEIRNWYYSYGKWHTNFGSSSSASMTIPICIEKGDTLCFDWQTLSGASYSGYSFRVTYGSNKELLKVTYATSGRVEKVFEEQVNGYLWIDTNLSAVVSNICIKHSGKVKVGKELNGATKSHLTDNLFVDGGYVWCEVTLPSGVQLVSDTVATRRNSISKQPSTSSFSVGLTIPDVGATYQWFRQTDVLDKKDDDVSALCTSSGSYKWSLKDGVWTSGNKYSDSSSTLKLEYDLQSGEELSFDCFVSSESGYDYLTVTSSLGSDYGWKASGNGQKKSYKINVPGKQTWTFVYSKDDSGNSYEDCAKVSNIRVTGGTGDYIGEAITGATSSTFNKISQMSVGDIIYCEVTLPNGRKMRSDNVTLNIGVESIEISESKATVNVGQTLTLSATVLPNEAIEKSIKWSSSDNSIATVSYSGVVKGITAGTAIITAEAADGSGVKSTATITVWQPVSSLTLSKTAVELKKGEKVTVTATILPNTASNKTVTWSSSNPNVATVNNGVISAVGVGNAIITASVGKEAKTICSVIVASNTVILVDGEKYTNSKTSVLEELTYKRTFNNTNWQALYVPFSMSYDDWKDDFEVAKINNVNMYDTDDNGEVDETILEIIKIKKGTLKPNNPYLIKAKSAGEKDITLADATLYPAAVNSLDVSSAEVKFTFAGTYSGVSGSEMVANKYYALSAGALSYTELSNVSLKPYRWYMKVESRDPQVILPSMANSRIRIKVVGEEEMTNIDDVELTSVNYNVVYSLDGRVASRNGAEGLRPGIYISNGKKVFVK